MHSNKNFSKKKAITPAWIHFLSLKYHSHSFFFLAHLKEEGLFYFLSSWIGI